MESIPAGRLEQFVAAAHRVVDYGLTHCASGNLSCRLDESRMLITATGAWMADLTAAQVALCRISDCASLNGAKPSKEIAFHAGVLRARRDVEVVLHFQSPCATTIACRDPQVTDFSVIPEIPYYVGPVAAVPYLPPGSRELADAVTVAMADHDMAVLRNHGQVTAGASFDDALEKAVNFEFACRVVLDAGPGICFMPEEAIAEQRRLRQASSSG